MAGRRTTGRKTSGCRTTGCMMSRCRMSGCRTGRQDRRTEVVRRKSVDGSRSTDESCPWTEVVRWTEVRGQKSHGRKSNLRRTCRASPPLLRWRAAALHCSDASSRCYSLRRATRQRYCNTRRERATTLFLQLSSRQRCNVIAAAPVARAQRRGCSRHRSNAAAARVTAAVLQQALQQRCGAASARVVATLKQASWQRRGAVASSQQRQRATRWRDGQCSRQRQAARIFVFLFFIFYSTVSKREQKQDREKRDRASKPVSRLCWLA